MAALDLATILIWLAIASTAYTLYLAIFRLFFHPLRDFPGPLHARLTYWTEFYWDVVCRGQYCWRLDEWHRRYGPIIRINPDELHVSDSKYYDTIYPGTSANRKVDKWTQQAKLFGTSLSAFGTVKHDLHRARRAPLAPLFTRKAVIDLQDLIDEKLADFMNRMKQFQGTGMPVELFAAFSALTGDIISRYSFGKDMGLLESKDFAPEWRQLIVDYATLGAVGRQIGFLWPLLNALPNRLLHALNPAMGKITYMKEMTHDRIVEVMAERSAANGDRMHKTQRTIFHDILDSDLPAEEKRVERVREEADIVMAAGTVTTAETLAVICFHVLNEPALFNKIREELLPVMQAADGSPRWTDLEQLPFLTAVIKEALRISPGVTARLPRISPDKAIECHGWSIPAGTPVSMSSWTVHWDPAIFPEPTKFKPERWLTTDVNGHFVSSTKLDTYLVSFGKGTRQCVGITLAWAEMYLTLAKLLGSTHLSLELFNTSARDVEVVGDIFNPDFPRDSKGVRVLVN